MNDLDSVSAVIWLIPVKRGGCRNMLMRFYKLWDKVKQFMEMKGKSIRELHDRKRLHYLAFMDITK